MTSTTAKYIVLKVGTRGFTLASLHPDGRKHREEAKRHARYLSEKDGIETMVVTVLDTYRPKEGTITRATGNYSCTQGAGYCNHPQCKPNQIGFGEQAIKSIKAKYHE